MLELVLYLVMGWMVLFVITDVKEKLLGPGMYYLVIGGICVSFGVIFFKLGEYFPIYHVIWHIFVIFANGFAFIAIFYYLDVGNG